MLKNRISFVFYFLIKEVLSILFVLFIQTWNTFSRHLKKNCHRKNHWFSILSKVEFSWGPIFKTNTSIGRFIFSFFKKQKFLFFFYIISSKHFRWDPAFNWIFIDTLHKFYNNIASNDCEKFERTISKHSTAYSLV